MHACASERAREHLKEGECGILVLLTLLLDVCASYLRQRHPPPLRALSLARTHTHVQHAPNCEHPYTCTIFMVGVSVCVWLTHAQTKAHTYTHRIRGDRGGEWEVLKNGAKHYKLN